MASEGRLDIILGWDGTRIGRVDIRSSRPEVARRVLVGKTSTEAVRAVPLLFGVCARAQTAAALAARDAALTIACPEPLHRRRELLVNAEAALDHLWRLLLDWPAFLGLPPAPHLLAEVRKEFAGRLRGMEMQETPASEPHPPVGDVLDGFLQRRVLGMAPRQWLCLDLAGAEAWMRRGETEVARLLGALWDEPAWESGGALPLTEASPGQAPALWHVLDADDGFAARPHWQGEARETGPASRCGGQPLVAEALAVRGTTVATRVLARVAELAGLAAALHGQGAGAIQGASRATGEGAAWVQCARGLLMHFVRLEGESVADYRIVAPTEWNFHPEGTFRKAWEGLNITDRAALGARASALALALDPCVPYAVRIEGA